MSPRRGFPPRHVALVVLAAVVVADQALKIVLTHWIPAGASVVLVPGVIALTNVRNPGIAFSALPGIPLVVPVLIALTLIFMLFYTGGRWSRRPRAQVALALMAGGAVGNLIDRVRVGAVIDYLDLRIWPVFNMADAAITVGAGLLILTLLQPAGDRR